jgi:uncharacterized membrane protein
MHKNRLEAFSDAVIAIVITILVLELKVPHSADAAALVPLVPVFVSYVLSFVYLGIYWNNHHHLLQAAMHVDGRILWANLHLLFWLSLFPFVTGWMGENRFARLPVILYGTVLFCAGFAYYLLECLLVARHGKDSSLASALRGERKAIVSVVAYLAAIALAFVSPWISCAIYVVVAALWFVPDARIERVLAARGGG